VRRFSGHAALVTGASSGIGRAVALRLASEGAAVLCCDLVEAPVAGGVPTVEMIRATGGTAAFAACDVAEEGALEHAVAAAGDLGPRLGIYVLNAGVFSRDVSILDETVEEHDRILRVNERGVWLGLRAAGRRLVAEGDGGKIVCMGSISGLVGLTDEPAYCASKGAVVNLVRAAALDLAPHRVSVNAVCPGFVETPMLRPALEDPQRLLRLKRSTPWPRLGRPEDVSAAVAFLASDDAEWVTGTALVVDGGYTCR